MTLAELASLGSFISGIAVLISLVYLSIQVRQAEKNQRALMQQARADRASNATLKLAEKEMTAVYASGMAGDENLSAEDVMRFLNMARSGFISAEDTFLHHKTGQIEEGTWQGVLAGLRGWCSAPGFRAAWAMRSGMYSSEFRAFIDDIMRATPVAGESDIRAAWAEAVRKEKASARP